MMIMINFLILMRFYPYHSRRRPYMLYLTIKRKKKKKKKKSLHYLWRGS